MRVAEVVRGLLPTTEAAAYCGFRTPSALRKARLEGRVFPVGRRGGAGSWMWAIKDLDGFLRGEGPVRSSVERSGAPPQGEAHEEEAEGLEAEEGRVDLDQTSAARRVAAEGRGTSRERSRSRKHD